MADLDFYDHTGMTVHSRFDTPMTIQGLPTDFHISVEKLPKMTIGSDPVHFSFDKLPKIQIGSDPVEISMRLTETPSVRTHLPADFSVGLSLFGLEVLCMRVCGEAQMITEPYRPNPCEVCGAPYG